MPEVGDFERSCRDTARQLRSLPDLVASALVREAPARVAGPVAERVAARWAGPWARVLAAATKASEGTPTGVVVSGTSPVVSQGASVNDLVFGTEFGGGRRRTTQQFVPRRSALIPTIQNETSAIEDAYAALVQDTIEEATRG